MREMHPRRRRFERGATVVESVVPTHLLHRDIRGATFVEYILLVGCVALVAMVGVQVFGTATREKANAQAECVASLESCAGAPMGGSPSDLEDGPITGAAPTDQNASNVPAAPPPPSFTRQLGDAFLGTFTGAGKWVYNSVSAPTGLVLGAIDWALREAGVNFQFGKPPILPTNGYERNAGYAMDIVSIAPGAMVVAPKIVSKLGAAYRAKFLTIREATSGGRATEAVAQAIESSVARSTLSPSVVEQGSAKRARQIAQAFSENSPERAALARGHFLVRAPKGAEARMIPSINIKTPLDADHNAAFWNTLSRTPRPAWRYVNTNYLNDATGAPIRDLRRVAVFSSHGSPWGYSSASTQEAAKLSAEVILRENALRAPGDRLEFLVLDACRQGNGRFLGIGKTNAQAFQTALDRAIGASGAGTDRVIVLAAERPGVLYAAWDTPAMRVNGIMMPARFVPASAQMGGVDAELVKGIAQEVGVGLGVGAGAIGVYHLIPFPWDDDR
jgi:pilus assembly protein Flp/PilA